MTGDVTLRDAIGRLDEWSDDATLYVEGEASEWRADSLTGVGIEDAEAESETLPPEAAGKRYFLEVSIAKEVLAGWQGSLGRDATIDEKVERVIHYARFDA